MKKPRVEGDQTIGLDVVWPNGQTITLMIEVLIEGAPPTNTLEPGRHVFGKNKGEQFTVVITPGPLT